MVSLPLVIAVAVGVPVLCALHAFVMFIVNRLVDEEDDRKKLAALRNKGDRAIQSQTNASADVAQQSGSGARRRMSSGARPEPAAAGGGDAGPWSRRM